MIKPAQLGSLGDSDIPATRTLATASGTPCAIMPPVFGVSRFFVVRGTIPAISFSRSLASLSNTASGDFGTDLLKRSRIKCARIPARCSCPERPAQQSLIEAVGARLSLPGKLRSGRSGPNHDRPAEAVWITRQSRQPGKTRKACRPDQCRRLSATRP